MIRGFYDQKTIVKNGKVYLLELDEVNKIEFDVNIGYDVSQEDEKEFLEDLKLFCISRGMNLDYHLTEENTKHNGRARYQFKSAD